MGNSCDHTVFYGDKAAVFGINFNLSNRIPQNYNNLFNKPTINGQSIEGDLLLSQLGLRAIYYDTTDNWNSQVNLLSEAGALYIYSDYKVEEDELGNRTVTPGIRIGDGTSYLIDLPFLSGGDTEILYGHIQDASAHVSDSDRDFWNNKITTYIDSNDSENLILSKDYYAP